MEAVFKGRKNYTWSWKSSKDLHCLWENYDINSYPTLKKCFAWCSCITEKLFIWRFALTKTEKKKNKKKQKKNFVLEERVFFVNSTEIYNFKAKDSEIVRTPLYLGNISKGFSVDNMKNAGLNMVYYSSVDYDATAIDDILGIHKDLMIQNNMTQKWLQLDSNPEPLSS